MGLVSPSRQGAPGPFWSQLPDGSGGWLRVWGLGNRPWGRGVQAGEVGYVLAQILLNGVARSQITSLSIFGGVQTSAWSGSNITFRGNLLGVWGSYLDAMKPHNP